MMNSEVDFDNLQQTQEDEFEATQLSDQPSQVAPEEYLWGSLIPCNQHCIPVNFHRRLPRYRLGRAQGNDVIFPGVKVSNEHCIIAWDGHESEIACVTVKDTSSNGTFINGIKIGRGKSGALKEGNEIAFGTVTPQSPESRDDYRFIFRFHATPGPKAGLYAEYDILYELGKGAFATVMKAMEKRTGTLCAVKMIHTKTIGQPADNELRELQLDREIDIIASLSHPNICAFKKMFKQPDGGRNLVIELVPGGDLLDYIIKHNGLNEGMAQHVTYQMCDALSYCHSQNIAHRDLKPENILLTNDLVPQVKIADFGLAKVADSATMLRTMCGTPSYLAPEIINQVDNSGYGNVVDSWSLGVILYSMIANTAPFIEDPNIVDTKMSIIMRTIEWSFLQAKNVSLMCQHFVKQLLQNDPAERMTCTAALSHPWLMEFDPHYKYTDVVGYLPPSQRNTGSFVVHDVSMMSTLPDADYQPSAASLQNPPPAISRRSQVIQSLIDQDKDLPGFDLPADVIANFERSREALVQEQQQQQTMNVNTNGKRSLSPMSEDHQSDDDAMDITSPRKKARNSDSNMSDIEGTPAKKGNGKTPAKVSKKKALPLADTAAPRRSARNAKAR